MKISNRCSDLSSDPGETHDLSEEAPNLVRKMTTTLDEWRETHPVANRTEVPSVDTLYPRRFGDWATQDYAHARASEHYDLQYAIPYPHRNMRSGRPVQKTALYDRLVTAGAVMGQIAGWERALWFETETSRDLGDLSFHDEPWHAAVREECRIVHEVAGLMDHGGFTKFTVSGAGAEAFLNRVFCGAMPRPGRIKLSYMLTPQGRIWSEATIARLDPDRFLLCGPTLASLRDYDWLKSHLPADGVRLERGNVHDAAILLMGPKSRDILQPLTDADLSARAAPWLSVAEIRVAGAPVTALRVSYVGELGWELHMAEHDLTTVYDALEREGARHGAGRFGSYALNVMRIEKGYHGWGSDFGTEYTLFDAGLERFANRRNPEFTGRDAVIAQSEHPSEWEWIGLEVTAPSPDPLQSEPILADGGVVGYVTSAAKGFRTGKTLVLGYIKRDAIQMSAQCSVSILGAPYPAVRHDPVQYDPENLAMKM